MRYHARVKKSKKTHATLSLSVVVGFDWWLSICTSLLSWIAADPAIDNTRKQQRSRSIIVSEEKNILVPHLANKAHGRPLVLHAPPAGNRDGVVVVLLGC